MEDQELITIARQNAEKLEVNSDNPNEAIFKTLLLCFAELVEQGKPKEEVFAALGQLGHETIKVSLARKYSRWEKQGDFLSDSIDNEEEIEKTPEDLEWEKHQARSSAYIRRQAALFDALPTERLLPYKDQYVFFEEDEIKDHDKDREDLIDRVYETVGYRAIFVHKVV